MSAGETSVPLDELLAHREWVRRLALAITRDEHEADDVEQATWVAALRRPPTHRTSLRGWLGTTVRRAAGRLRRAERRRLHHEAAVPARGRADDAAELVSRADAHRRVVEALVALEEPLRRTLLLRYFEGLAVGEVAARTGVPLETCRARLRRGRALLRDRLERELGGRDALGAAVLLLAGREHGGGVASAAGGVAMAATGTKVAAAIAVAALAGAGVWWSSRGSPETPPATTAPAERAAPPAPSQSPSERAAPPPAAAPGESAAARPPVPIESPPAPAVPSPSAREKLDAAMVTVEWQDVRVLDALGELSLRADVELFLSETLLAELAGSKGARTTMEMDNVPAGMLLEILGPSASLAHVVEERRVVLRRIGTDPPAEATLRRVPTGPLGPGGNPARLTFRVLDERGTPVAGAVVRIAGSSAVSEPTGADGATAVERRLVPTRYFARKPYAVDSHIRAVDASVAPETVVELKLRGPSGHLRGIVKSAKGDPVGGARVSWDADSEKDRPTDPTPDVPVETEPHLFLTARDGSFDDPSAPLGPGRLRVAAQGFATVVVPAEVRRGSAAPVEVVLRPEAVLTGTVRASDGRKRLHVVVAVVRESDGSHFGAFTTEADGSFRHGALPAGRAVVRVVQSFDPGATDAPPLAETTVDLTEGGTTTWDPVIELPPR